MCNHRFAVNKNYIIMLFVKVTLITPLALHRNVSTYLKHVVLLRSSHHDPSFYEVNHHLKKTTKKHLNIQSSVEI